MRAPRTTPWIHGWIRLLACCLQSINACQVVARAVSLRIHHACMAHLARLSATNLRIALGSSTYLAVQTGWSLSSTVHTLGSRTLITRRGWNITKHMKSQQRTAEQQSSRAAKQQSFACQRLCLPLACLLVRFLACFVVRYSSMYCSVVLHTPYVVLRTT